VSASKHHQYGAMQRKNPKCVRVTKYLHSLSLDAELAKACFARAGRGDKNSKARQTNKVTSHNSGT
jgi:hypothetical protein